MLLIDHMPLEGEYELSPVSWAREQVEKVLEAGTTDVIDFDGCPLVLVTMKGARTGKLRKVLVGRIEHEGVYAIVASLGGAPKNPAWYHNVKANPHVDLQDGTVVKDYQAREVLGEEKAGWWERIVSTYPGYAEYQEKTDRRIPVFVLEPIAA